MPGAQKSKKAAHVLCCAACAYRMFSTISFWAITLNFNSKFRYKFRNLAF